MYWLLLIGLVSVPGWILRRGVEQDNRAARVAGGVGIVGALAFFAFLSFLSELYWFQAVDYGGRFWRMLAAKVVATMLGAVAGGAVCGVLHRPLAAEPRWLRRGAVLASAAIGAFVGLGSWDEGLLFLNRVETGVLEPVFELDSSFYLFVLPLLDRAYGLLAVVALLAIGASAFSLFASPREAVVTPLSGTIVRLGTIGPWPRPLLWSAAGLAAVAAAGMLLARYHLLYSEWGVVAGPGWTDVHVRLPAYWIVAVLTLGLGVAPLVPPVARRLHLLLGREVPCGVSSARSRCPGSQSPSCGSWRSWPCPT